MLYVINIARIIECRLADNIEYSDNYKRKRSSLTLELYDERNALERCMLHFANFEKTTEEIGEKTYKVKLTYNKDDETEVVHLPTPC